MRKKDRKTLLNHWFYYYGHVPCTLEDIETFHNLLEEQEDKVMMYVITAFMLPDIGGRTVTTEILIGAIRSGKLNELLDKLPAFDSLDKEVCKQYKAIEELILDQCEETYFNPEPPVPMDITEMLEPGESAAVINLDNINEQNNGIVIIRKPNKI